MYVANARAVRDATDLISQDASSVLAVQAAGAEGPESEKGDAQQGLAAARHQRIVRLGRRPHCKAGLSAAAPAAASRKGPLLTSTLQLTQS